MKTIVRTIDYMSERVGNLACWLCLALVGVMTYEVIMRYVFNTPGVWTAETSMMLGATIACLGWAYTHQLHGHVRVDVIYRLLPPRVKATIDVTFALLFLFPSYLVLSYYAAGELLHSWSTGEKLAYTFWFPPAGPIRTILFLGFSLFVLQSAAHFVRDMHFLVRNKRYD